MRRYGDEPIKIRKHSLTSQITNEEKQESNNLHNTDQHQDPMGMQFSNQTKDQIITWGSHMHLYIKFRQYRIFLRKLEIWRNVHFTYDVTAVILDFR